MKLLQIDVEAGVEVCKTKGHDIFMHVDPFGAPEEFEPKNPKFKDIVDCGEKNITAVLLNSFNVAFWRDIIYKLMGREEQTKHIVMLLLRACKDSIDDVDLMELDRSANIALAETKSNTNIVLGCLSGPSEMVEYAAVLNKFREERGSYPSKSPSAWVDLAIKASTFYTGRLENNKRLLPFVEEARYG